MCFDNLFILCCYVYINRNDLVRFQKMVNLLVLIFTVCSASIVTVEVDTDLHYYLCTEEGQGRLSKPETVLQLVRGKEYYINQSRQFCVIKDFANLTITTNGSGVATITCNRSSIPSDFTIASGCGLAFINGTGLKLERLVFRLFGSALNAGLLGGDNATELHSYFGTNQTASLFFSNANSLCMSMVRISEYYGYAGVIVNSFENNLLKNILVESSMSHAVCPLIVPHLSYDNYTCFGSGLLIYYHDPVIERNKKISNVLFTVENSTFINNTYKDTHSICITNVFQFQPERVPIIAGAAVTIYATQASFNVSVKFKSSLISNNDGAICGGLASIFIDTPFKSFITVEDTLMTNNNNSYFSCLGESLLVYTHFTNSFLRSDRARSIGLNNYMKAWELFTVINTKITDNVGYNRSSSVYLGIRSQALYEIRTLFQNVLFMNNHALFTGICMFAETIYEPMSASGKLLQVHLKNINATSNSQIMQEGNVVLSNSSQFVFYRVGRVIIEGEQHLTSSFVNNIGSVIDAFGSEIYLKGSVAFKHNRAAMGAAILLRSDSFLVFGENSSVLFEGNLAYENGGAIYSVEKGTEDNYCILQIDSDKNNVSDSNIHVTLKDNRAFGSGSFAYVTPLFHCFQTRFHVFPRYLSSLYGSVFNLDKHTLDSEISTTPTHVCVCTLVDGTYRPDCVNKRSQPLQIFPGDTLSAYLVAFDDVNNKVTSQVNASLSEVNSIFSPLSDWHLRNSQVIHNIINKNCTQLNYTIYSTNLTTWKGQLNFAIPNRQPVTSIEIHLKYCPPGFTLNSYGECICLSFFHDIGLTCSTSGKTIQKHSDYNWIGVITFSNVTLVGYAEYCPIGYCNHTLQEIVMTSSSSTICVSDRVGPLCGNCRDGYSAVHGGVECKLCSDNDLWWLVGNVSSGLIAVFILLLLKLTISVGTIVGIVFYANTFSIVRLTLNRSKTYFLPFLQVIEIVNLQQAFPSCLFNGMQYAHQYLISYTYSVYLWMIVLLVIIVSRCSHHLSRLLMSSSVQVLVTLIHLSFAKILSATIDTFTCTKIHLENKSYTAWLYNGTIEYGTGICMHTSCLFDTN